MTRWRNVPSEKSTSSKGCIQSSVGVCTGGFTYLATPSETVQGIEKT